MTRPGRIIVICVGNEFRTDDGAGPAVRTRLTSLLPADVDVLLSDGEPVSLVEAWTGACTAIVVDAMYGGPAEPGTLHRIVVRQPGAGPPGEAQPTGDRRPDPGAGSTSSHGIGVGTAISLGAALGRLPAELVVHAIQAADAGYGTGLSPAVAARLPELANAVAADVRSALSRGLGSCSPGGGECSGGG